MGGVRVGGGGVGRVRAQRVPDICSRGLKFVAFVGMEWFWLAMEVVKIISLPWATRTQRSTSQPTPLGRALSEPWVHFNGGPRAKVPYYLSGGPVTGHIAGWLGINVHAGNRNAWKEGSLPSRIEPDGS